MVARNMHRTVSPFLYYAPRITVTPFNHSSPTPSLTPFLFLSSRPFLPTPRHSPSLPSNSLPSPPTPTPHAPLLVFAVFSAGQAHLDFPLSLSPKLLQHNRYAAIDEDGNTVRLTTMEPDTSKRIFWEEAGVWVLPLLFTFPSPLTVVPKGDIDVVGTPQVVFAHMNKHVCTTLEMTRNMENAAYPFFLNEVHRQLRDEDSHCSLVCCVALR